MRKQYKIFGLVLLVAVCADDPSRADGDPADSAQESSQSKEIDYSQESPIGIVHLIARPNTASLLFWVDGPRGEEVGIGMQAALIRPLLGQYIREHDHPRHVFFVLRDPSGLFRRIADTAIKAADWNAKSGSPRQGTVTDFIVQKINTKHLALELEDSFAAFGYALKAKSAEQIIVNKPNSARPGRVPISGVIGFIAEKQTSK